MAYNPPRGISQYIHSTFHWLALKVAVTSTSSSPVTSLKTHKCPVQGCDRAFYKRSRLKEHNANVHDPSLKTHKCPVEDCHCAFYYPGELLKHTPSHFRPPDECGEERERIPITEELLNEMYVEAMTLSDAVRVAPDGPVDAIGRNHLGYGRLCFESYPRGQDFRGTSTGIRFKNRPPIIIPRENGIVVTAMDMAINGQKYGSKKPGSPEHSAQPPEHSAQPSPTLSSKGHCASVIFSTLLSARHESKEGNAREAVTQVMDCISPELVDDINRIWLFISAFIEKELLGKAFQKFSEMRCFTCVSVTKNGELLYPQHLLRGNSGNGDKDPAGTFAAYNALAEYCRAGGLEYPALKAFVNTKGIVHGPCRIHFYNTTDGCMGWHLDTFNPGASDLKFKVVVLIPLEDNVAGSLGIAEDCTSPTCTSPTRKQLFPQVG